MFNIKEGNKEITKGHEANKKMANDTCKSNYINSDIKYEWNKYSSQKSEIVRLDRKASPTICCLQDTLSIQRHK